MESVATPSLFEKISRRSLATIEATSNAVVKRFYQVLRKANREDRPVFLDIDRTAPALRELDRNYAVIRQEVEQLLAQRLNLPSYHELDKRQTYISDSSPQKWKVFLLYVMGVKPKENRALCPRTSALLDKIPNLMEAFFSILDAGKSIPVHGNTYPGYLRYHLGLVIPKENPPTIRVHDRFHTWKEGESLLFDDSWDHEVYNQSTSERVILLVDILRPYPWPLFQLNRIYAKGFLRFAYASGLLKNLEKFR